MSDEAWRKERDAEAQRKTQAAQFLVGRTIAAATVMPHADDCDGVNVLRLRFDDGAVVGPDWSVQRAQAGAGGKGGAVSDRTGWEPRPLRLDGKYPDERTRWPENPDYWNQVQVHRAATWWYWIDGQRFAVNLTTIGEPDIAGVQHPVGRVARALPVRHDGGPLLTSLFWWEGQ